MYPLGTIRDKYLQRWLYLAAVADGSGRIIVCFMIEADATEQQALLQFLSCRILMEMWKKRLKRSSIQVS